MNELQFRHDKGKKINKFLNKPPCANWCSITNCYKTGLKIKKVVQIMLAR